MGVKKLGIIATTGVIALANTGIGTAKSKEKLCDEKNLEFQIQGSMYDDVNDHIVQ